MILQRERRDSEMSESETMKQLSALWSAYKGRGEIPAREKLILHYAPLVKYVAGRVAIGLPPSVELDDLVSYGVFGLMDALDKYEPTRGVKFETYALARIRGAMIDGLRSVDWVPRSVRQKAREFEAASQKLETSLGRAATDRELAAAMGLSDDEYTQMLSEVACTTLNSLDDLWHNDADGDDPVRVADSVKDTQAEDPLERLEFTELKRALAGAIDQLAERERLVLALYYYEGLTLKEIGKVLEVTEARISQIHSKAILRLRGKLGRWNSA